jgi:hypothetical protein
MYLDTCLLGSRSLTGHTYVHSGKISYSFIKYRCTSCHAPFSFIKIQTQTPNLHCTQIPFDWMVFFLLYFYDLLLYLPKCIPDTGALLLHFSLNWTFNYFPHSFHCLISLIQFRLIETCVCFLVYKKLRS